MLKCYNKFTHLATFLCSVVSIVEAAVWIIFIFIEYQDFINNHPDSLKSVICGLVAIGMLILLAVVHMKFYCKYIR